MTKMYLAARIEKGEGLDILDPRMEKFDNFNRALNYTTDMKRQELRDNFRIPSSADDDFLRWMRSDEHPIVGSDELIKMYWNDVATDVTVIARYAELNIDEGWKVLEVSY